MHPGPVLLLALDLTGTFVFALNGALTAVRAARLDVVGVVTLGMMTALAAALSATLSSATFHLRRFVIGVTSRWPSGADWWRLRSASC